MAPYESLYGRHYKLPFVWFELTEVELLGPDSVYEAIDKVSPMKGIMRFGRKGKLSPRFIGPYEILRRIGKQAYELKLSSKMAIVHPVFHILILRFYNVDPSQVLNHEEIEINEGFSCEEEPVQVLDRQVRRLRMKDVASVKVL
ncbi:uncharacterized protein LOC132061320 [Lycium ferocissimum]|uniref:uncharacterized protein LOC132061320 n=1 Tax=Lycium ferocissimum TaxID=112874 RepID=UPI0028156B3F|nr:uncharacterized protein LOC132061320 [Lycium ferocissimum]